MVNLTLFSSSEMEIKNIKNCAKKLIRVIMEGFHTTYTWKTIITWNFVTYFSGLDNALNFLKKCLILTENLEKQEISKCSCTSFSFKMSLYKIKDHLIFVISMLLTQKLIEAKNYLEFHPFNLEITWKVPDIECHHRSGKPANIPNLGIVYFQNI